MDWLNNTMDHISENAVGYAVGSVIVIMIVGFAVYKCKYSQIVSFPAKTVVKIAEEVQKALTTGNVTELKKFVLELSAKRLKLDSAAEKQVLMIHRVIAMCDLKEVCKAATPPQPFPKEAEDLLNAANKVIADAKAVADDYIKNKKRSWNPLTWGK